MKISQSKNIKKPLFIASAVVVLVATVGIFAAKYYEVGYFNPNNDTSINLDEPTANEKKAAANIKQQSITQEASKTQTGSDPAPAPQPIDGSDKKSVGMEITATSQDESTLRIRALIKTITNTGTCSLSLTHATLPTYTAYADVQASSSSSTCKGFDIPLNQLGKGTWKISLSFSSNELTASTEQGINIQ